jgi:hypothetical protein
MSNTNSLDQQIAETGPQATPVILINHLTGAGYEVSGVNQDNITLITASGVTSNQTSATQTNSNARGVVVWLNMTNVGTGSVTVLIQGIDPVSGNSYNIFTGSAITSNTFIAYTVYPAVANGSTSADQVIPRSWRVYVQANNNNPTTYTVSQAYNI